MKKLHLNEMTCFVFTLFCLLFTAAGGLFAADDTPPPESPSGVRVAILGESFSDERDSMGFNEEIFGRLLRLISQKKPSAVIFAGDLALGLERKKGTSQVTYAPLENIPGPETDVYGDNWPSEGYFYDSQSYRKELEAFSGMWSKIFDEKIPFYPIVAKHEALGPGSAALFKDQFKVKNLASPDASELAYTVPIGGALFVVFSTARYDEAAKSVVEHEISPALLDWLEDVLEEASKKYNFVFVIGNEPAFSTTASSGNYRGYDKHATQRDAFWKILLNYHVTAYFCAHERLYDRTNRYGIWQIISGGAGAPLYKREFDKAFYHYLLLTIPDNPKQSPKVQVYDVHGTLNDEFELTSNRYPVYQLRISKSQHP